MPAPYHSLFYRPYALPATQTTVSRHWRQITEIMQCWNHINPKSCAHNVLVTLLKDNSEYSRNCCDTVRTTSAGASVPWRIPAAFWGSCRPAWRPVPTAGSTNDARLGCARTRRTPLGLCCRTAAAHAQTTYHRWPPTLLLMQEVGPTTCLLDIRPYRAVECRHTSRTAAATSCRRARSTDQSVSSEHRDPYSHRSFHLIALAKSI